MPYAKRVMGGGTSAGQANAIVGGASDGIVATGSTYADAYQLAPVNAVRIGTSSASTGVKLSVGGPGDSVAIYNNSGQTQLIYPPSGAQINALTATTQGFSMTDGLKASFYCTSATHWFAVLGS